MSDLNKTGDVGVDRSYHWRRIDQHTQRGVKLQLINKESGVAVYGTLGSHNTFFDHWAPLPTFKD